MDLATMLHHTWTYQALVHDVLELELNRVVISDTPPSPGINEAPKRGKTKEYDLNANDKFWLSHKGSPFPQVAEAVQEELESYRSSEEEIKRIKHAMGLDGGESDEAISMISDATAKLTTTVSSLPELLERKRLIDLHTNVATAVLDHIKVRKLDQFFETEEKLLNRQMPDTPLIDTLRDPACGSTEDKLRLFLINYICSDSLSDSELKQQMAILEAAGADDAAVKFVKRWKSFTKMVSRDDHLGAGTKTVSMFSKLLNHSSQLVMEGVKNLVPKRHNLPVTKVVDAIMEVKTGAETDEYRYFDPKLMRANESAVPRTRAPANDAIVFVIGGGNYVEYQNLMDYRKHKSQGAVAKRITYGTTELVTASQFIAQLTRLGSQV
uniref:Sec1 family domain-containing protein 1 n=1 Tax=Plectus sambesii TaxID=2011161 RepID=A0A914UW23_9BILA